MRRSRFPPFVTAACFLFLYLPIFVLAVNSFNASRFGGVWGGFSLRWYGMLFSDRSIWQAARNTLIVGGVSTFVSVVLGTSGAFALHRYRSALQRVHYAFIYVPLVVPDILMGISLLLFFVAIGLRLSLFTIILGHTTFCISYVAVTVLARLQDFDFQVVEAARDLGAGRWTIAWKIVLPLLAPGIVAGGLLAFSLSIDDFIITFFTSGPGSSTLPIKIYSMIRHGNPPVINALSTLFLTVTAVIALVYQRYNRRKT